MYGHGGPKISKKVEKETDKVVGGGKVDVGGSRMAAGGSIFYNCNIKIFQASVCLF